MPKTISKIHQRVMKAQRLRVDKTNQDIDKIISDGMEIDRSGDADMLAFNNQTWADLNTLREELANATMTFTGQVYALINNPQVLESLGEHKAKFDRLAQTFFTDAQAFSSRVAELRAQHEHRTGPFTSLEEYGEFNKLALQYQNANDELRVLLAPTISEMVLIVHEQITVAAQQTALLDPKVVSDVEVKV